MRAVMLWILILHMFHLPLPCPDLDGECRGTPITSFAESHAWHVLILGVRPNDDIDRGPFRTDDPNDDTAPVESPFGDAGVSQSSVSTVAQAELELAEPRFQSYSLPPHVDTGRGFRGAQSHQDNERAPYSRTFCARCSVLLI